MFRQLQIFFTEYCNNFSGHSSLSFTPGNVTTSLPPWALRQQQQQQLKKFIVRWK